MYERDYFNFLRNHPHFNGEFEGMENYIFYFRTKEKESFFGEISFPYKSNEPFDFMFHISTVEERIKILERKSNGGDISLAPIWFQELTKAAESKFEQLTRVRKIVNVRFQETEN